MCIRDDPNNIFYEYKQCSKISVYNFLTCDSFSLIPSKYGKDKESYFKNNIYYNSRNPTLQQQELLKTINNCKTVKDFIDEFNNIQTVPFIDKLKVMDYKNIYNTDLETIKNTIDDLNDEVECIKNYIEEAFDDINEYIGSNKNNISDDLMNISLVPTSFEGKTYEPKMIIDNDLILTQDNLLEEAVSYYRDNNIKIIDIVEVIKLMLNSSKYILSDDFKKNKLDLKDIQFKFKMMTSPESISRDDILAEVFNIDNTVSLI
jgi:hypothetical protein